LERVDFLAIQETKLEVVSDSVCYSLWGNNDWEWVSCPAVGNSGGILSIWRKSIGTLVFSIVGDGFVGVCLDLFVKQIRVCVINVYSKCHLVDKRRLWHDLLMSRRGFGDTLWCVVGDFNSVTDPIERRGVALVDGASHALEMREFNQFLEEMELVDVPLLGRQFTWFHPNGGTMSRLDKMLLSFDWYALWGNPKVWVLDRDVSDHCPIILRYDEADWGPKPFRFNNFWLKNKHFKDLVRRRGMINTSLVGWGLYLKIVLRILRVSLKG
jgi:exonuclease III